MSANGTSSPYPASKRILSSATGIGLLLDPDGVLCAPCGTVAGWLVASSAEVGILAAERLAIPPLAAAPRSNASSY